MRSGRMLLKVIAPGLLLIAMLLLVPGCDIPLDDGSRPPAYHPPHRKPMDHRPDMPPPPPPPPAPHNPGDQDRDDIQSFRKLDKNHDGRLGLDEFQKMLPGPRGAQVFSEKDRNRDGLLDLNEFIRATERPAPPPAQPSPRPAPSKPREEKRKDKDDDKADPRSFKGLDRNHDGKLSLDEYQKLVPGDDGKDLFMRKDRNDNSYLSEVEFESDAPERPYRDRDRDRYRDRDRDHGGHGGPGGKPHDGKDDDDGKAPDNGKKLTFNELDQNDDQKLSLEELSRLRPGELGKQAMDKADLNHNGFIDRNEFLLLM